MSCPRHLHVLRNDKGDGVDAAKRQKLNHTKHDRASSGGKEKSVQNAVNRASEATNRKRLAQQLDVIAECKKKINQLEEAVDRNARNKVCVYSF